MTFVVHGATGAQGTPVVAALATLGWGVRALVRDPASYTGPGRGVGVDLADPASLVAAYRGAEGVFVHLPVGLPAQQLAHALAIADAVEAARPGRVVMSTSGWTLDDPESAVAVLARRLAVSGVSSVVVHPRLFLEDLLLPAVVGPVDRGGVLAYPLREDCTVSWSSHLDVADAVVRLLGDPFTTGTVGVGALPGLVGADLARGFAEDRGRPVRFESLDPEAFGRLITPLLGPGAAPVVDAHRWRATQAHDLVDEATSAQRLLGLAPRSVPQWLHDVRG